MENYPGSNAFNCRTRNHEYKRYHLIGGNAGDVIDKDCTGIPQVDWQNDSRYIEG